jgi:hypothetical protein
MNVASLELCRELYELSGWDDTFIKYRSYKGGSWDAGEWWTAPRTDPSTSGMDELPAYDLGYLLRKLAGIEEQHRFSIHHVRTFFAIYEGASLHAESNGNSDTPEDAAAKLCTTLYKHGILKKSQL